MVFVYLMARSWTFNALSEDIQLILITFLYLALTVKGPRVSSFGFFFAMKTYRYLARRVADPDPVGSEPFWSDRILIPPENVIKQEINLIY